MVARNYTFVVAGEFGRRHRMAFDDLEVTISSGRTVLSAHLPDQAAVYGVLHRLEELGLQVIDFHSVPSSTRS